MHTISARGIALMTLINVMTVRAVSEEVFEELPKASGGRKPTFSTTITTRRESECADRCENLQECLGFRYAKICGKCNLLSASEVDNLKTGRDTANIYRRRFKTDLALGKPAFMSSVWSDYEPPSKGNDGDLANMFHSLTYDDEWWKVDLEVVRFVVAVRVLNTENHVYYRAKNVEVRVSLTDGGLSESQSICTDHPGTLARSWTTLTCPTIMRGQWIQLINKVDDWFHLREVEVHGY